MVREYGPFRERFEEYIQERTPNHPCLILMIMGQQESPSIRVWRLGECVLDFPRSEAHKGGQQSIANPLK